MGSPFRVDPPHLSTQIKAPICGTTAGATAKSIVWPPRADGKTGTASNMAKAIDLEESANWE